MCKYSGPSDTCASKTAFRELSAAAKEAILDQHNEMRRKVAKGQERRGSNGPQPGASNMKKLVWNTELESIAQRWADQCPNDHEPAGSSVRVKLDGTPVGQNLHFGAITSLGGHASHAKVIAMSSSAPESWFKEVNDFNSQHINPFKYTEKPVI